ncbi:hypothetical protein ACP70R_014922 [Stipagrostis hirtigluma subsp. patula]
MAASSVLIPPPSLLHPALPRPPPRPPTAAGPRATLPPALLASMAVPVTSPPAPPPPPLRCNTPTDGKKRGPPLPPSGKHAKKPKTTGPPSPLAPCGSVGVAEATAMSAERRRALDRKVAGCFLDRSWVGAAARHEGRTALRCLCRELPRGSPCAIHQDVPGRAWMLAAHQQDSGVPLVGGEGEVVVPKVRNGAAAEVFAEYARWRRGVRLPSRFYVEHLRAINADKKD